MQSAIQMDVDVDIISKSMSHCIKEWLDPFYTLQQVDHLSCLSHVYVQDIKLIKKNHICKMSKEYLGTSKVSQTLIFGNPKNVVLI